MRILIAIASLAWCIGAIGQAHNFAECLEGSDFIRNAARSRDSGATRAFFVGRLEEDLVMIRSVPPALRWFVRNPDDEAFLRTEVEAVFDAPEDSELHRSGFLERCARRAMRLASPDT
jgi:hypothetical protein